MGFLKVLLSESLEVYNVGNNKPEVTMYELAKILTGIIKGGSKIEVIDYPKTYLLRAAEDVLI